MEQERLRQAAAERQQKMLDDAQRLLDMAQKLKLSVDKSTKDQLSMEVVREADQIEKLARQVKDRMRQ